MIPMVPKRLLDQVAFNGDMTKPHQSESNEADVTIIT